MANRYLISFFPKDESVSYLETLKCRVMLTPFRRMCCQFNYSSRWIYIKLRPRLHVQQVSKVNSTCLLSRRLPQTSRQLQEKITTCCQNRFGKVHGRYSAITYSARIRATTVATGPKTQLPKSPCRGVRILTSNFSLKRIVAKNELEEYSGFKFHVKFENVR